MSTHKKTTYKLKITVGVIIFGFLFIFLVTSELINAIFSNKLDAAGATIIERVAFAFKPTVLAIYIVFSTILTILVNKFLKPLYTYLNTGEQYDKARIATIKLPWTIILFQIGVWLLGTTIYYALKGWTAESGIPYFLGLSLKISSGFIGALYVVFTLNLSLLKVKKKLNITEIRKGENDSFSNLKDYMSTAGASFYVMVHMAYVSYYFSQIQNAIPIGVFYLKIIPVTLFLMMVGFGPIILSKREYRFQIQILLKELKNLATKQTKISEKMYIFNFDELGEMAVWINSITQEYNSLLSKITDAVNSLSQSSLDLSVTSKESSLSSNQQAAAVAEIVSTMEDSDRMSKTIGDRAKEVEDKSVHMRSQVQEGAQTIKQYLETMDQVRIATEKTIEFIDSLILDIKAIWEVITIIKSIADQVKIIAFNAELEASAAGDAGRNFEIVATEIRRLADNTLTSTTEIRQKIGIIETGASSLIEASQETTGLIESGWNILKKPNHPLILS
jgi:methyl-accepting chemotaxis protein